MEQLVNGIYNIYWQNKKTRFFFVITSFTYCFSRIVLLYLITTDKKRNQSFKWLMHVSVWERFIVKNLILATCSLYSVFL